MKKTFFYIFSGFLSINLLAQKQKSLDSIYSSYFENTREIPYLHLNKTSFLSGEEIWFKAYILEQNSNKLHPTSSNLFVSVFEESGKMKSQHLIRVKKGVGNGNILIDSTFNKGTYYIKASTNWMKNFNEDQSFTQNINISNILIDKKSKTLNEENFFEFKLFPEGGHLLANSINKVGILVKNSKNIGIKIIKGTITDQNNNFISNFSTNSLGLGQVSFLFKKNTSYTFIAKLANGTVLSKNTLQPRSIGIILTTKKDNNFLNLNIVTNKKSLQLLKKEKYTILWHNTKKYKKFSFNLYDTINIIAFNKSKLFDGINIFTLFNQKNIPIVEKLYFNEGEKLFTELNISKSSVINDSLSITIVNNTNQNVNFSSSVLPSQTKSYNPKHNIKSIFLLKPYIKGYIQNPKYYFNKFNKNRKEDLELLLLTQGWSKYSWKDIFHNPPKTIYDFENGIDIGIKLNRKLGKYWSVLLYSKENNLLSTLKGNKDLYNLKNTFVKKNTFVNFSLRYNSNSYEIKPILNFSKNNLVDNFNLHKKEPLRKIELSVKNFKPLPKVVEELDEITLKTNLKEKIEKPFGAETMYTKVRLENIIFGAGETVVDLLNSKGFKISTTHNIALGKGSMKSLTHAIAEKMYSTNDIVKNNNSKDKYISDNGSNINRNFGQQSSRNLLITLNNNVISETLWNLESIYLDMVKELYISSFYGIHIYTYSSKEMIKKNYSSSQIKISNGFETPKEYYIPKYTSLLDDNFKTFGAVYWTPNNNIKPKSEMKLTIPANLQKNFRVFIEGISESGKLLSKQELIIVD
ncbi:hypothetical protein [Polaribacter porphyrae]|uniref:Macroglobulin domain-containing protein n=1 Tax=Polaribacter porphyrae TaxID=1137780 RepID=A0A2S7WT84_9FLAO|nr:hypothetical protein [Polaribacter porphyrae]PQJ80521.1 hypothetical protein BTO18_15660 [Polaribacter porphyrae]